MGAFSAPEAALMASIAWSYFRSCINSRTCSATSGASADCDKAVFAPRQHRTSQTHGTTALRQKKQFIESLPCSLGLDRLARQSDSAGNRRRRAVQGGWRCSSHLTIIAYASLVRAHRHPYPFDATGDDLVPEISAVGEPFHTLPVTVSPAHSRANSLSTLISRWTVRLPK